MIFVALAAVAVAFGLYCIRVQASPAHVIARYAETLWVVYTGDTVLIGLAQLRPLLTTRRTPTPSLASMSISESVLNSSMRPRRRSLTRGCVTRRIFAASACFNRLDSIAF